MRLTNISEVDTFIKLINECKGDVWLESVEGDKINLKSKLSQYIAISALISIEGDHLDLYCSLPEDEMRFIAFFRENPNTL